MIYMNDNEQENNAMQPTTPPTARPLNQNGAGPLKSRIIVTVNGGVAELADAENWPKGLELYIVDYDVIEGNDDEEFADVDGECTISCYTDIHRQSVTYAQDVAVEYERLKGA